MPPAASSHPPQPRQRVVAAPPLSLCLDFANTRFWRGTATPTESLPDYAALQQWLDQSGVLDADAVRSLGLLPSADATAAQQLYGDALLLRELLYRFFSALADSTQELSKAAASTAAGGTADNTAGNAAGPSAANAADVQSLAAWLAGTPARQRWVFGQDGGQGGGQNGGHGVAERSLSGWQLAMLTPSASEVLAPVLWSAADLSLAWQRQRQRLCRCANPQCLWLFLDDSKGGSRRWCSMSSCGNRAKVKRHFLRHSGREADSSL